MNRPNPPPSLPKEKDLREVFDRWLYNFWEFVVNGSAADANVILAWDAFQRRADSARTFEYVAGDLVVTGNTTLGDTSGDTLTINAGTWTLGSNFVATRAAGALAAGSQNIATWTLTYSGDVGGTSQANTFVLNVTGSGSNAVVSQFGHRLNSTWSGSANITNQLLNSFAASVISGTGDVATIKGYRSEFTLTNSGKATAGHNFIAETPTLSSTGAILTHIGFLSRNLGHATLVNNAIGHDAENMTVAAILTASYRSVQNSGAGAWGFFHNGTANNAFKGNVRIGSTTAPTVALDVTGAGAISGDLTLPSAPSDPILQAQIFGG